MVALRVLRHRFRSEPHGHTGYSGEGHRLIQQRGTGGPLARAALHLRGFIGLRGLAKIGFIRFGTRAKSSIGSKCGSGLSVTPWGHGTYHRRDEEGQILQEKEADVPHHLETRTAHPAASCLFPRLFSRPALVRWSKWRRGCTIECLHLLARGLQCSSCTSTRFFSVSKEPPAPARSRSRPAGAFLFICINLSLSLSLSVSFLLPVSQFSPSSLP